MNICSNVMPVTQAECGKSSVKNFMQDLKIIDCENSADIRSYFDIVKNDPYLSITIEQVFYEVHGFGRFTHWCHIVSKFYKPKSFRITLG